MLSIVMSTYNNEDTVTRAAESILLESCVEKLVIVNDGSTDNTAHSLKVLSENHGSRVVLLYNHVNQGLSYSLNRGIREIDTPFIGRMDADDVSKFGRLQAQLDYLVDNPDCDILGTYAVTKKGGKEHILRKHTNYSALLADIVWDCPLIHPTVIARSEVFNLFEYDESLRRAQDWELWSRCIKEFRIENLPIIGLEYSLNTRKSMKAIFSRFSVALLIERQFNRPLRGFFYNRIIFVKSILRRLAHPK